MFAYASLQTFALLGITILSVSGWAITLIRQRAESKKIEEDRFHLDYLNTYLKLAARDRNTFIFKENLDTGDAEFLFSSNAEAMNRKPLVGAERYKHIPEGYHDLVKTAAKIIGQPVEYKFLLPETNQYEWIRQTTLAEYQNKRGETIRIQSSAIINRIKNLEVELGEVTTLLRQATELGEIGIFSHNLSNDMLKGNARFFELMALPTDLKEITLDTFVGQISGVPKEDLLEDISRHKDRDYIQKRTVMVGEGVDYRWVEFRFRALMVNGEATSIEGVLFDVTEREAYEKRLLELNRHFERVEEQLNRVTDANGVGIYEVRQDTREFTVNSQFRAIAGLPEDKFPQIFAKDYVARMSEATQKVWSQQRSEEQLDTQYVRVRELIMDDGSTKFVRTTTISKYSDEKGYSTLYGVMTDVTEEHKQLIELQRIQRATQLANEAAKVVVFEIDLETDFAEVVSGVSSFPHLYQEKPFMEVMKGLHKLDDLNKLSIAQSEPGKPASVALYQYESDEMAYNAQIGFSKPYVSEGKHYQMAYRLITDEFVEATEKALKYSEQLSKAQRVTELALELADMVVFEIDQDGGAIEVVAGHSPVYPEGSTYKFDELVKLVYVDEDREKLLEAKENPGTLVWVQTLSPETSQPLYWSAIGFSQKYQRDGNEFQMLYRQNITELVEAQKLAASREEHLVETVAELEKRRAAQAQMFAIIGHELRTPVASLKMLIEASNCIDKLENGHLLSKTVDHILDVLDDLRMVAKPEEQIKNDIRSLYLPAEMEQYSQMLMPLVNEQGFTMSLDVSELPESEVELPVQALRQVVINLSKNALIHSKGSRLDIKGAVSEQGGGSWLKVSIEDDGIGISTEEIDDLFSPFIRVRTDADGTGLGLHICQELALSMGGDIVYEPNTPKGSRFTLTIPISQMDTNPLHDEAESKRVCYSLEGAKVLLAEDNPTLQLLTKNVLEKKGAVVTATSNGKSALASFNDEEYDFVISDIFMPEMDGYGLAKALREAEFNGPIIGLTAATIGDETEQMLQAGADRVLAKPISVEALKAALLELSV